MSNSKLVSYTRLSPNCTKPRNHAIDTISIHCFVGQVTAKSGCDAGCFVKYDPQNGSSCNYVVGKDGSIGLCVDEADRSWCTSNRANDHRAVTIEVASESTHPYAVTPQAYAALIDLLVDICERNHIPELRWHADKSLIGQTDKQNMTVHRWFANKACPGDYLYNLHYQIAADVNERLKGAEEMTGEQIAAALSSEDCQEILRKARKELQDNDASDYSAAARDWAVANGIIKGGEANEFNGMWEDMLTREQMAVLLYRFAQLMGKA